MNAVEQVASRIRDWLDADPTGSGAYADVQRINSDGWTLEQSIPGDPNWVRRIENVHLSEPELQRAWALAQEEEEC